MYLPFTNPFRGYLSWLHGLTLSMLWLMGGCRSQKNDPDPDSVMVSLVHRNRFLTNPLRAMVGPRLLTVFLQHTFTQSLTRQATRTGDSLRLDEMGSVNPIPYQLRASRLPD